MATRTSSDSGLAERDWTACSGRIKWSSQDPMATAHEDEEIGSPSTTTPPDATVSNMPGDNLNKEDADTSIAAPTEALLPARDKLANFRILTGINSGPALSKISILQRPAPNLGIYGRTVRAEARAALQFKCFATLINGCLGLQIVVATALTALGASQGPHGAVTAFGAINTIIAGFLTYLKGSGLPNRLKYYENEWTKVREYIEQRERDFGREGCKLDVEKEIITVERMYEEVREDIEANTPDSYTNMSEAKNQKGTRPRPAISEPGSEKARVRDGVGSIHV